MACDVATGASLPTTARDRRVFGDAHCPRTRPQCAGFRLCGLLLPCVRGGCAGRVSRVYLALCFGRRQGQGSRRRRAPGAAMDKLSPPGADERGNPRPAMDKASLIGIIVGVVCMGILPAFMCRTATS